jgi:hypothetical protein
MATRKQMVLIIRRYLERELAKNDHSGSHSPVTMANTILDKIEKGMTDFRWQPEPVKLVPDKSEVQAILHRNDAGDVALSTARDIRQQRAEDGHWPGPASWDD